jgi:hypothetical protein
MKRVDAKKKKRVNAKKQTRVNAKKLEACKRKKLKRVNATTKNKEHKNNILLYLLKYLTISTYG